MIELTKNELLKLAGDELRNAAQYVESSNENPKFLEAAEKRVARSLELLKGAKELE